MEKMIAFCGIVCTNCPAFIATQEDNHEKRREIAKTWSTPEYELKPEDINCDGCLVRDGRLVSFVRACDIRKCGIERNVENCAHCPEYACEKLAKSHERSPEGKETLEEIRLRDV